MKYYLALLSDSTSQLYFSSLVDIFDYYKLSNSLVYLKVNNVQRASADISVLHNPLDYAIDHFDHGKKSLVLYITTKDYYLTGNPVYDYNKYIVIHEMSFCESQK